MSRLEAVGVNAPQIEYWNGPTGDKWARFADAQDQMLGDLGSVAMNACDIQLGHWVLDVGCGSGTTSIEMARRVGSEGRVHGIDISTPMLDVGRARLDALDINNVTFHNKDVATYRFEQKAFDRMYSRFGVMFFVDPVSAFTNIRSGLKSNGRLAFVCWQAADKNPWMEVPWRVVLKHVSAPPGSDPEAPGAMAFSNPDRIRSILFEAGFAELKIDALETLVPVEPDVPASVQRLMELGPAARLLNNISDNVKERVQKDLSDAISGFQTADGVMMGSTTWIVSAISS